MNPPHDVVITTVPPMAVTVRLGPELLRLVRGLLVIQGTSLRREAERMGTSYNNAKNAFCRNRDTPNQKRLRAAIMSRAKLPVI